MVDRLEHDLEQGKFLSYEAAKALFDQKPDVSGRLRALFGRDNVRQLVDLLTEQNLVELDILVATGELSKVEAIQYVKLVPEFAQLAVKEAALIESLVSLWQPQLAARFRAQMSGQRTNLHELIKAISDLFAIVPKETGYWRSSCKMNIQLHLMGRLFIEIDNQLQPKEKTAFRAYLQTLKRDFRTIDGDEFPGIVFFHEYQQTKALLADRVVLARLDNLFFRPPIAVNDTHRTVISQDVEKKVRAINHLREYRKVLAHHHIPCGIIIGIHRDDYGMDVENGAGIVANVQLILDREVSFELPTIRLADMGIKGTYKRSHQSLHPKVVYAAVDVQGDIKFCNNHTLSVEELLGTDRYLLLKQKVLTLILSYLAGKDDDIPDLFRNPTATVRTEVATVMKDTVAPVPQVETVNADALPDLFRDPEAIVRVEVATVMKGTEAPVSQAETSSDLPDESSVEVDASLGMIFTEGLAVPDTVISTPSVVVTPEVLAAATPYKRKFRRSLKAPVVLEALKALLGDPVRISGSHYIFRGKNGRTYPIPLHAGDVNPHILRRGLEIWEISPEAFLTRIRN